MDEKDWLILKTLQEKRNITQTAAAVYISQQALSKRLKLVEERFGVSVALRNKNGDILYRNTWVIVNEEAKQLKVVERFIDFVSTFSFKNEFGSLQPPHKV